MQIGDFELEVAEAKPSVSPGPSSAASFMGSPTALFDDPFQQGGEAVKPSHKTSVDPFATDAGGSFLLPIAPAEPESSDGRDSHFPEVVTSTLSSPMTPIDPRQSGEPLQEGRASPALPDQVATSLPSPAHGSYIPDDWMAAPSSDHLTDRATAPDPFAASHPTASPSVLPSGALSPFPALGDSSSQQDKGGVPQSRLGADAAILASFMKGVGIREWPTDIDVQRSVEEAGMALRVLVGVLARLLSARRAMKREFRIQQTSLMNEGNNALKFSVDQNELIGVVLGRSRPGFLTGRVAIEDAASTLELHQVAVLAGFRAVLTEVFTRLSPDSILEAETAEILDRLVPSAGKARLWERYCHVHKELQADLAENFAGRLGQIFAEAYEREKPRGR